MLLLPDRRQSVGPVQPRWQGHRDRGHHHQGQRRQVPRGQIHQVGGKFNAAD